MHPMLCTLLLLQTSFFTKPLYLEEEPPELRTARHITLLHTELPKVPAGASGTKKEALAYADELHELLAQGADFVNLARENSMSRTRTSGAVLGTYASGMLTQSLDEFLFEAELGAFSEPISTNTGVHILQRVATHAGAMQIMVSGATDESKAKCEELLKQLGQGADFRELAKEHSDDKSSAEQGGEFMIFERGYGDRMIKRKIFELTDGQIFGPFESPLGFHILKRVPPSELKHATVEEKTIRLSAILVSYAGAFGSVQNSIERDQREAREIIDALNARLQAGEDFATLAAEFTDEAGGRARAGDIGWVHRMTPDLPVFMDRMFSRPAGYTTSPITTSAGYALLKRTK